MPSAPVDYKLGDMHNANPASGVGSAGIQQGQRFTVDKDITINTLWFRNASALTNTQVGNSVTYKVSVWRVSDGARIASATWGLGVQTTTGWKSAACTPVTLVAGVNYVISIYYVDNNFNGTNVSAQYTNYGTHVHAVGSVNWTVEGQWYNGVTGGDIYPGTASGTNAEMYLGFTGTTNTAPTAPTVTAPNGGEVINASVNITWTAGTDPDGDALTYDIDYSANNGGAWTNIVTGVSGLAYLWNTSAITAGSSYLVRIRSSDTAGAKSGYDQSNAVFSISHNVAPNPATWVSPASNTTLDRSLAQTLTFQFNDPNGGDVLTKFDYRYRLVGAPTWTSTGTVTGSTPSLTLAANALAAGTYEFQVLTYDGQGVAATGWSASLQEVFADAPAAPVINTPASGGTVNTATGVAAWTVGNQTDYQVQRVRDNAGVIDTATVYQDTGIVTSATARDAPLNFETNNRYEWIRVRIRNIGLWSAWSSVRYQVSYTPPANPSGITFTYPTTDPDAIQVNVTNPVPVGTQPAVSKIELWRRARTDIDGNVITGPDAYANRVATLNPSAGGVTSFIDYTPASGVQYEYQAVILGVNNTWSYSPWVS